MKFDPHTNFAEFKKEKNEKYKPFNENLRVLRANKMEMANLVAEQLSNKTIPFSKSNVVKFFKAQNKSISNFLKNTSRSRREGVMESLYVEDKRIMSMLEKNL